MSTIARCFPQILLLLALLGQPVSAADLPAADLADDDVDVSYRDGTYSARLSFPVGASPATALNVLTDFDHMVGVVPNLESSRIISRAGRVFVIEQRGKADFGPFSVRFESRRRVEVFPDGRLVADALSGSTKYMHSELRVQAQGRGARIDYQAEMIPDRWLPSSLGVSFMRHELAEQFNALRREMERRQAAA